MSLDSRFFVLQHSSKNADPADPNYEFTYAGYSARFGSPMVLYSEHDGFPLAVLELLFQDKKNYVKGFDSFLTELSSEDERQQFQGIVTNDNQKIEFVITNLTGDYINFNLMKCDKKVTEVNPQGLNQVNELRPFESYAIQCDQTQDNRVLMLKTHEKQTSNESDKHVTLESEMTKSSSEKVGSYLYLSVVPHYGNTDLETRFSKTYWKPVDYFVVRSRSRKYQHHYNTGYGFNNGLDLQSESISAASMGRQMGEVHFMGQNIERIVERGERLSDLVEHQSQQLHPTVKEVQKCCKISPTTRTFSDDSCEEAGFDTHEVLLIDEIEDRVDMSQVMKSQVANIISGNEKLDVQTMETGIEYNYDKHSMPCVLGLSVMQDFKLVHMSNEQMKSSVQELIKSYVDNTFKDLVAQMQVYTSETCCVCMSEAPDCVFYRCGHQCVDQSCGEKLDKCPLCRCVIGARLKQKFEKPEPVNTVSLEEVIVVA